MTLKLKSSFAGALDMTSSLFLTSKLAKWFNYFHALTFTFSLFVAMRRSTWLSDAWLSAVSEGKSLRFDKRYVMILKFNDCFEVRKRGSSGILVI